MTVKFVAEHQPVPPEAPAGMPFRPVEFDGLTVTPYVDDKRGRVAYSFRATGMHAPSPARPARPTPGDGWRPVLRGGGLTTTQAEGSHGGHRAPLLISHTQARPRQAPLVSEGHEGR